MSLLARVQALAHEIWREYYPRILSAEQIDYMLAAGYSLEALEQQQQSGVHFELIEDAGFVAYGPHTAKVFKLHKLYLRASERGHGLGQRTLKRVEDACRSLGADKLILNVNKQNAQAIAAYERAGYTRESEVIIDIGGGFVMDDYVYGKALA